MVLVDQVLWEVWFSSKDTNFIINQSKQSIFFDHFNDKLPDNLIINNIKKKLTFSSLFSSEKVNIFHHLNCAGGSVTNSEIR